MSDFFLSYSVLGYATSFFIFIVTAYLVGRGALNFSMTLLFLIFSLVAGFLVSNQDIFRDFMSGKEKSTDQAKEGDLKSKFSNAIESLKKEIEELKSKPK